MEEEIKKEVKIEPEKFYIEILEEETEKFKNHYVDPVLFTRQLKDYQEKREYNELHGLPEAKIPEEIGTTILKICTNLSKRYNFRGYSFLDEMVSEGVVHCINAVKKYQVREGKSPPFSYFTFIASFAFIRKIKSEQKEREKRVSMTGDINYITASVQEQDSLDEYSNEMRENFYNLYSDH